MTKHRIHNRYHLYWDIGYSDRITYVRTQNPQSITYTRTQDAESISLTLGHRIFNQYHVHKDTGYTVSLIQGQRFYI